MILWHILVSLLVGLCASADVEDVDLQTLITAEYEEGQPLPAGIQRLDGQRVRIMGFMDNGTQEGTSVFLLVSDGCGCEGKIMVHHFVEVDLGSEVTGYTPMRITVVGTMSVGEQHDEDGFVTSVYRIAAESVN